MRMLRAMTTAVTYLRVSSADQVQNTSLDDQDERTKKHLAEKGWNLLRVFREEGRSAKDDDRPQLKALLQFCAETEVDFVVALDMSRLSRNTETYLRIRKNLSSIGTRLSFVSFDPGDTPEGEFIATVTAAASELENRLRGQKAKNGMIATRKAGGWTTFAPKGYRCVRVGRLPSLEPTPEAPLVAQAFEDLAAGRKTLKEAGRSIGIAKPDEFFRRPVFAGYNEIDGELVKGKWPPIVPLAIWHRVQESMKHKVHIRQTDFWLRGMLRCECGHMLTASFSKGRHRKYGYYHCVYCKARHSADALENRFREWLDTLAKEQAQVTATIKKDAAGQFRRLLEAAEAYKRKAVEQSSEITRRLSALIDLKLDGGISSEEYDQKRLALLARRKELQLAIEHGFITADMYMVLLQDEEYILSNFTDFLGKAGYDELLVVARTMVGSKIDVSASGEFSNREKDGLYWLNSLLCHSNQEVAPPDGVCWNRDFRGVSTKVRIARAVLEHVMKEAK